jgi:hypothetical protein
MLARPYAMVQNTTKGVWWRHFTMLECVVKEILVDRKLRGENHIMKDRKQRKTKGLETQSIIIFKCKPPVS